MNLPTATLIVLAILTALLVVYFQYFFKEKENRSRPILSFLRFLSILSVLILLINPKIDQIEYKTVKPKLMVAVDNSGSVLYSKQDSISKDLTDQIEGDKKLNEKFSVEYFTFGTSLKSSKKYTFDENRTDIFEALKGLNTLSDSNIAPLIFISDGNQTYGSDYSYYRSKQNIYPVIIGDTTNYPDLEISHINVNSYSFLQNKFPVEVFLNYSGNTDIKAKFLIVKDGEVIYSENINFSKDPNTAYLQFNLPADKIGKHLYRAKIEAFQGEKNTVNNLKEFSVEVIDEQTNISLVYDVLHPDIGMLKRSVESNKQHKLNLMDIDLLNIDSLENEVIIIYQPNHKFKRIFEKITSSNSNYFLITGKQTDWDFLNNSQQVFKKEILQRPENYHPVYRDNFTTFHVENIGFDEFPPLEDLFGEITFFVDHNTLLDQNINGIITEKPLLSTFSNLNSRGVVLFGENIWKWRALSFNAEQSFQQFDQFINAIVQYLSIAKKSNPIELTYNSIYYTDEPIKISAKSYDTNFKFDEKANLELTIEGQQKPLPFYLNRTGFELLINNLKPADYNFTVKNLNNGKKATGSFTVLEYSIEQQNISTNYKRLELLAYHSKGKAFYPDQLKDLLELLESDPNYITIQKEEKDTVSFIDWKWLLGLIILSLGLEWFIRKYRGLV